MEDEEALEVPKTEEEKVSTTEEAFNSNFEALFEELKMKKPSGTIV